MSEKSCTFALEIKESTNKKEIYYEKHQGNDRDYACL